MSDKLTKTSNEIAVATSFKDAVEKSALEISSKDAAEEQRSALEDFKLDPDPDKVLKRTQRIKRYVEERLNRQKSFFSEAKEPIRSNPDLAKLFTAEITAEIQQLEEALTKAHEREVLQIYVNAATGNDDNDGLTPATPLKSISAAYAKSSSSESTGLVINLAGTFRLR